MNSTSKIALSLAIITLAITNHAHAGFAEAFNFFKLGQYEIAEREFLNCANDNDINCQYHLGFLYYPNDVKWIKKDKDRGIYWYRKAADGGHGYAQYELGQILRLKNGDAAGGFTLLTSAANNGITQASNVIGLLAFEKKAYPDALKWFEKSASGGNAEAMANLASMLIEGNGTTKDVPKARALLEQAVKKNNALAHYNLAQLYINGESVPKDFAKAIELLKKASALGLEGPNVSALIDELNGTSSPPSGTLSRGTTVRKREK